MGIKKPNPPEIQGFRQYLSDSGVQDSKAIWLVKWIERLSIAAQGKEFFDGAVNEYLQSMAGRFPDWQIRQASEAYARYASMVKAEGGVATVQTMNWAHEAREQLRLLHYSYRTEQSYLDWIRRFGSYVTETGVGLDASSVRLFLVHINRGTGVAASTLNQAHHAVDFPRSFPVKRFQGFSRKWMERPPSWRVCSMGVVYGSWSAVVSG